MKEVVLSILMFCGASSAYAANIHDEHGATVFAQDPSRTSQDADTGRNDKTSLSKTLTVSGCWIRSLPKPIPSAGYFVIKNTGLNDEKLISLAISAFDQVSLHQTINEDGKSKMSMAHEISIPAGGELKFKPGSYHAMLEKPAKTLPVGSHIEAGFTFSSGEKATTMCAVKPANAVSE